MMNSEKMEMKKKCSKMRKKKNEIHAGIDRVDYKVEKEN